VVAVRFEISLVLSLGLFLCALGFSQTGDSTHLGGGSLALNAQICDPTAIAIARGSLFVVEGCGYPFAIRKIDLKTGAFSTLTTLLSDESIEDLAANADGNLIAADEPHGRILLINTSSGSVEGVAGTGYYGFSGDGGPATKADFEQPAGVALDQAGNIFVADSGNSRIRRIDARTGIITTVAGSCQKGIAGDGGLALEAGLEWPVSIAVDRAGNLYIGQDTNNPALTRIRKVDAQTGLISTYSKSDAQPDAMLFDGRGDLVFAEDSRIKRVESATGVVRTIAGSTEGFSGDGGPAVNSRLENPSALAIDESGNLYVADFVSHRIRRIFLKDGTIETFAGSGEPHHVHVSL
jgi:DNA-binding beta-propeller fold protein YncE